jgi:hypothetical protein
MSSYNLLKYLDYFLNSDNLINKNLIFILKIEIAKKLLQIGDAELKQFESNEYFYSALNINSDQISKNNITSFDDTVYINKLIDQYLSFLRQGDYCYELLSDAQNNLEFQDLIDNGFFLKNNFITCDLASELREKILFLSRFEKDNEIGHFYGNSKMQRIWNLPLKISQLDSLLWQPTIINILEKYFNRKTFHQKYFLSSFQANIIHPGADDGTWHRDNNVPDPHPQWPIKLNFMIPLEDIDKLNGATEIACESHLVDNKINPCEIDSFKRLHLKAESGSLISWTGRLWHKSSANSSNTPRVVLLIMFSSSIFKEISTEEFYGTHELNDNGYLKFPNRFKSLIGFNHGKRLGT